MDSEVTNQLPEQLNPYPLEAPAAGGMPGGLGPMEPQEAEEGLQWGRYLQVVRRYKWLIMAITILGSGAGGFASRFIKPEYTVVSTLWIDTYDQRRDRAGPIRAGGLFESFAWVELLRTGAVMDSVALRLRLYLDVATPTDTVMFRDLRLGSGFQPGNYVLRLEGPGGEYRLETDDNRVLERGIPGDSIGRSIGLEWAPPADLLGHDRTVTFSMVTPREAGRSHFPTNAGRRNRTTVRRLLHRRVPPPRTVSFLRPAGTG